MDESKYVFRLNILKDELDALPRLEGKPSPEVVRQRHVQVWSGRTLEPYCRSAVGLAKIAALLEEKAELSALVSIRHRGRTIKWADFFFGEDSSPRLLKLLRSEDYQNAKYPVAVLVRPTKLCPSTNGRAEHIQCGREIVEDEPRTLMIPRLYGLPKILKSVRANEDYIIFGDWYASKPKDDVGSNADPTPHNAVSFENISVNLHQSAQLCALEDE
ncbi:hypothetical protein MHY87_15080 [Microvirga sp. ACRRW]|uniref:hypothetical protein n=1 Tax=Microvirga sp. ACRRW TaxID=2918205 RepID=UPI001EF6EF95|nr:hypothetical protein [Microvirga sp. ACRRW]MCG7394228.1 hypothetical protein [Microvirga sp. ACRRW]